MGEPPSGTVTFLFTDIEGSTRLLQELGAAYETALNTHRDLLRKAFADHGGYEVGSAAPNRGLLTATMARFDEAERHFEDDSALRAPFDDDDSDRLRNAL